MHAFLQEQRDKNHISEKDVVIFCGDLNVNRFACDPERGPDAPERGPRSHLGAVNEEYLDMLEILQAEDHFPAPGDLESTETGEAGRAFYSANPDINNYAKPGPCSDGEYELLDFVLLSKEYEKADMANVWVEPIKSSVKYVGPFTPDIQDDLSDHMPVWGHFTFHSTNSTAGTGEVPNNIAQYHHDPVSANGAKDCVRI